tara:strand:- start:66 stop:515 length:450 start_codon:yes stop_codon:yes gene_type:complete
MRNSEIAVGVELWWHVLVIIACFALVYMSLGNSKAEIRPWNGLSYNDPNLKIKIFTYVFSIYLGVGECSITPNSGFAYMIKNVILFCRLLFVLHIARNIFDIIAAQITKSNEPKIAKIVKDYFNQMANQTRNQPLEFQYSTVTTGPGAV